MTFLLYFNFIQGKVTHWLSINWIKWINRIIRINCISSTKCTECITQHWLEFDGKFNKFVCVLCGGNNEIKHLAGKKTQKSMFMNELKKTLLIIRDILAIITKGSRALYGVHNNFPIMLKFERCVVRNMRYTHICLVPI